MEYINIEKGYTKENLTEIAKTIKSGGIVVAPTDTVYGIVANALDEKAVSKIYEIKQRDISNPMNILVSNIKMIKKSVQKITKTEKKIIENFFPGPLTIVFKKKKIIPDIVTAGIDTVGVRMPENKFMLDLIENLRNTDSCD